MEASRLDSCQICGFGGAGGLRVACRRLEWACRVLQEAWEGLDPALTRAVMPAVARAGMCIVYCVLRIVYWVLCIAYCVLRCVYWGLGLAV